jgi:exodeoxyribonuclease-3
VTNPDNVHRFLTWNILKGGGTRLPDIVREIGRLSPTVVALTEVTGNHVGRLRSGLKRIGFEHIASPCPTGGTNSVLVASKIPFEVVDAAIAEDHERWVAVRIPRLDVEVLCVHVPGSDDDKVRPGTYSLLGVERKELFWQDLTRYANARKGTRTILLGDFNTGLNHIDKTPDGAAFKLTHYIDTLLSDGYVDVWRDAHPDKREYTWFTWQKGKELNGFRLDYIYTSSALRGGIVNAQHVDHVRGLVKNGGLSDHAILVADLRL